MNDAIKYFIIVIICLLFLAFSMVPLNLWLPFYAFLPAWVQEETVVGLVFNSDMSTLLVIAGGITAFLLALRGLF